MYRAYFFVDPKTKKSPAREYLDGLDDRARGRFDKFIREFEARGTLPFPYASHLRGRLWEIRFRISRNRYRVLYALVADKRILLLLGFTKRTEKTPDSMIDRAERYLAVFEDN